VVLSQDPVASGFVRSLARPGGNLTGLTVLGTDLQGKVLLHHDHIYYPWVGQVLSFHPTADAAVRAAAWDALNRKQPGE
jgi:hypothetical protein